MSRTSRVRHLVGRLVRAILLFIVPPVAAAIGVYVYAASGRFVETENAYVKANVITISANVSGRVVWVGVGDNEVIAEGDLLFQIDPIPFEIALVGADAQVQVVRTEIESLRAEYFEAEESLGEVRELVRFLELQYERQKRLRAKGVGTEEKYDVAYHDLVAARQRIRTIGRRIESVLASLGGDAQSAPERHPRFREVKTKRDQVAIDLGDTAIHAPASGIVSNMKLQPGEYVTAGIPVFSLIESEPVWVEANLKETQLTHVRERQRATFVVDAYPDLVWDAEVESIAPATGAEFALLPPQNATGNWVKVVQRVPVHLRITARDDAPPLRAGMTVAISIDTERERDVHSLVRQALAWSGREP